MNVGPSLKFETGKIEILLDSLDEINFDEVDLESLVAVEACLHRVAKKARALATAAKYREKVRDGVIEYEPRFRVAAVHGGERHIEAT